MSPWRALRLSRRVRGSRDDEKHADQSWQYDGEMNVTIHGFLLSCGLPLPCDHGSCPIEQSHIAATYFNLVGLPPRRGSERCCKLFGEVLNARASEMIPRHGLGR